MAITRAYGQASQLGNTPAASNPVINSGFDIWQRGTSIASVLGYVYCADRWLIDSNTGRTVTQQATGDTTNLPDIRYCARVQRNSGNTSTSNVILEQNFETANSIPYAGKTVTLSFYARRGANFSSTSNSLSFYVITGTGTDQNQRSGYTNQAVPISSAATLTTTWQRFTSTGTIASTATEICVAFEYAPTGTAGAADYFEITGVQIDVGSVALPYRRSSATLAGELAACQRYYYLVVTNDSRGLIGGGQYNGATTVDALVPFPTTMRTEPTLVSTSGTNYYIFRANATDDSFDSVTIMGEVTTNNGGVYTTSGVSGTSGHAGNLYTGNTAASVAFSAEL